MLRSSLQYSTPQSPFKANQESLRTRRSKTKMSSHPYEQPEDNHEWVSATIKPITGLPQHYNTEREIVMQSNVDHSRTGWKQLQCLLDLALARNDQDLVNVILKSQLSLSVLDNDPQDRTIWDALSMGEVEMVTKLVRAGTDLNRRHPGTGATYLHWLVSKTEEKYRSLAILLMDYGADVNATDKKENSVLHVAAEYGLPRIVEELIRRNASIDVNNKSGQSVVYTAAKSSRAEDVLPILIGYSRDVMTRNKRCIDAFYAMTDSNASQRQFKVLFNLGFPLDLYGRKGSTLLYEAVLDKKIDLVKLLLQYGADVNKKLRNGKLPLHAAAQQKDPTILKLLIERGASVHNCSDDYNGQFPLHAACKYESLLNIKLLLRLGANVNVIDKNGRTPFSLVSVEKFTDLQSCLIKHIAITMSKDNVVNRSDLVRIRTSLDMQDFYEKCLVELQTMKETDLCEDVPFFIFFDRNLMDLASLMKIDFAKNLDEFKNEWKKLFPVYYNEIKHLSNQVEKMKLIMDQKADIVREISNNMLPDVVIKLITFYSSIDEIKQMQFNYHFTLIKE